MVGPLRFFFAGFVLLSGGLEVSDFFPVSHEPFQRGFHRVVRKGDLTALLKHHSVRHDPIPTPDVRDLRQKSLSFDSRRQQLWQQMLHGEPVKAAQPDGHEDPHQDLFEHAAKREPTVKQNERKTEPAQPQVPPQPELSTPQSPVGNFFPRGEQTGKHHHRRPDDAVDQTRKTPARCSFVAGTGVDQVGHDAQRENDR